MKIALFGASGATGRLLTQRCLAAGYQVTALLRTPETFPLRDQVQVVHGSVFDPNPVRLTIADADVVLSALGASSLKKEDVLERAVPQIVAAMQETFTQPKPVRRIIVLGSAGALPDSLDKQPAWRRWIVQNIVYNTFLKWPVASQISQWNTLSHSSLDWTMVMPPMLTNTPGHGTYRIDGEALPPNGSRISREDVADFIMQQIENPQWIRKGVYITW
ncbi:NAD(P)-dependent oxidoreductase [Tunturibacter empetritectus]|uniref:NADH-flavin reductase n=1 Tax=Tunturiibacter lichenicola TaxID=2051959 RepID=A0A7W8J8W3_9BACT|nr:NAD(P)H-binding protein [Edaphobacter lichenicola]MBB5344827.1 putative NADH-flavin reductase [Edaphobacter lichenicola]